jgi:hypothetical protein
LPVRKAIWTGPRRDSGVVKGEDAVFVKRRPVA